MAQIHITAGAGSPPRPLSELDLHSILKQFDTKEKRILHYAEGGVTKLLLQELPTVTSETLSELEEEQINVHDGVNVEDLFPTGIPQEYVVSESSELLFASNTNMQPEPICVSSAETLSSSTLGSKIMENEFKIIPGKSAVCEFCGYVSTIINKCQRCLRTLPDTVKLITDNRNITNTAQSATAVPVVTNILVRRAVPLLEFKKILLGKSALCKFCGKLSKVINKCQHCLCTLPDTVKLIPDKHIMNAAKHASEPPIAIDVQVREAMKADNNTCKTDARTVQPLQILQTVDTKRKRSSAHLSPTITVTEEPAILVLSSDEENKQEVEQLRKFAQNNSHPANGSLGNLSMESKTEDATIDAAASEKNSVASQGGGLLEQAMKGSLTRPFLLILCRGIRIGTFRVKPSEKVVLSSQGIEIKMPVPSGPEVLVNIALNLIERVLVSFCRTMPVLFLYLSKEGGVLVRQTLNMREPKPLYYFDPQSSDDTLKRITLLPEKISEDQKRTLKMIFGGNKVVLSEIENGLANDILRKSSLSEEQQRRNQRNKIQTVAVAPPPPVKEGIPSGTEEKTCQVEDMFHSVVSQQRPSYEDAPVRDQRAWYRKPEEPRVTGEPNSFPALAGSGRAPGVRSTGDPHSLDPDGYSRPGPGLEVLVDSSAVGPSRTLPLSSADDSPQGPADGAQLFQSFGAAAGSLESVERTLVRNLVHSLAQEPAQDPEELFARSLAATLRRLPTLRRWQAKMRLIAVLAEFEDP